MTFKQMIDRVKYTLGAEEITVNDEVALIKDFINEGIVQILVRTRPYTRVITLALTKDTAAHDMSNQILSLVDLEDSQGFLKRYSREDIVKAQHSGVRGFAYEEPLLWLSPIATEDGQKITAYGIFRPTPLVNDADDPQGAGLGGLSPEFHPTICTYALWKMGEYVQHEQSGGGEKYRIQYEGQDSTEGQIAWIKRVLAKRVTPQAGRRRDLESNVGILSPSGSYIGATGG